MLILVAILQSRRTEMHRTTQSKILRPKKHVSIFECAESHTVAARHASRETSPRATQLARARRMYSYRGYAIFRCHNDGIEGNFWCGSNPGRNLPIEQVVPTGSGRQKGKRSRETTDSEINLRVIRNVTKMSLLIIPLVPAKLSRIKRRGLSLAPRGVSRETL